MATLRGRPPFRADHIGSLLRPPALRQAFRDHHAGTLADGPFAETVESAIRDVVRVQEAAGLEVVTDGEFRRGSYWGRFVERVEGFGIRPAIFIFRDDHGHEAAFTAPYAERKLRRTQPIALDELQFLRTVTRASPKITLPSPSTLHFYRCTDFADPTVYADAQSLLVDLTAIYRAEIAALVAAGGRYFQFDEVAVALLCDPDIRARIVAEGMSPDRLVDLYIGCVNDIIAGFADDVVFGIHMCRGNFKGHYLAAGGYESVAERFFGTANVNHFLLEYDTARAGDFAPLRFLKNKGAVLGLVSSKLAALEDIDGLKRRVDEATGYIDLDRLAISPQCGFASTVAGNPITEADQRAKLTLVAEASRAIWG